MKFYTLYRSDDGLDVRLKVVTYEKCDYCARSYYQHFLCWCLAWFKATHCQSTNLHVCNL